MLNSLKTLKKIVHIFNDANGTMVEIGRLRVKHYHRVFIDESVYPVDPVGCQELLVSYLVHKVLARRYGDIV